MIRNLQLLPTFKSNFLIRNLGTANTKTSKSSNAKKPIMKLKTSTSKVATLDISKMPQPQPVLTPLSRTSSNVNDQNSEHPLFPSFKELLADSQKHSSSFRVELPNELLKRLPRTLVEIYEHFKGNFYALRKELLMEAYEASVESEDSAVILSGPEGSGKSVLLLQLYSMMKESFKNDPSKLLMYVPNASKWTLGYFPYYPIENEIANELVKEKLSFKQPELALEIINLLILGNKEKLSKDYDQEMAEAKLDPYTRAIPLYESILKRELLSLENRKLFILMDGVNGLIDENLMTKYSDQEGNPLPLKALPICTQFFVKPVRGIRVIGALTQSNPSLPRDHDSLQKNHFKNVNVPNYSIDELKSVLNLYSQLGHCSNNKSDQFVGMKLFVSGGNGRKLYKSCEYDSIYYKPS